MSFIKGLAAGCLVSHHNAGKRSGSGHFDWRSGNNVTVLYAGCCQCTCDHRAGHKSKVCGFYLNTTAFCRLYVGTTVSSCSDLGFRSNPFHIFTFISVSDFNGLYLVSACSEVIIHFVFLFIGKVGSQSYDFGAVCFCNHRQTGSEQRESYNKWDDFFKFFHNQSVFSPFLLYLVYYPNIPYTGLFANEIYLNNS